MYAFFIKWFLTANYSNTNVHFKNEWFYFCIIAYNMSESQKLRLDKYLWAIRLFKTRTLAAAACDSGKVKFNGSQAKASKHIIIGDEYEVKTEAKRWRIKVTGLLHNRVKYEEAIKYYVDITPAEEIQRLQFQAAAFYTGKRKSKIGRPTRKQRRDRDNFFEN